ncbi:MAG: tetratricopeptide repeat protein, partial [Planctomycetaceae bacterium]
MLLAAAVLTVTGCSDQRKQAQKLLAESTELRGAGRHAEALQKLSQAVALAPELAEAHFNRGLCLTAVKKPAEAVIALETAVRLKPRWAAALQALGLAQLEDNNVTAAEQSLSRAIEEDSRLTTALFARSRLRLKSLQESAALEDLDSVIRKSPEHLEARLQRARLLLESHPEQTVEDLTVLLQRDRLNSEALLLRGQAWGNAGNQQRALTDLAAACQLKPELHTAWRERGKQLRLAGDPDAARRDLQHAHLLAPQDAETLFEMALTEQLDGKHQTTAELLQQVLAISPQHPAARLESAACRLRSGEPETAVTILQQLLQDPLLAALKPAILNDARLQLARILEQLQQPAAALQQTTILLAERPHDDAAHRLHALLLQQMQKPAEALREYTWLVSRSSADPELRLLRASLHSETQQFTAALQDLNTVLEQTPAQPAALELRASVLQALGDPAAALRDVDALMQQPSVSPALRRRRADLLTLLQRPAEAADEYLHPDLLPQASEQILKTLVSQAATTGGTTAQLDLLARASAACPSAVSTELKLQQAGLLLETGDIDTAANTLQRLSNEQLLLPQALLLAARIQLANEHLPEAASLLLQIPEDSRTPEILQILANTLIRSGQRAEARKILNQLIQISPADVSLRTQRLDLLAEVEAWSEAEEDADIVLLSNPRCPAARLTRGMLQANAGNLTAALEDLESDEVRTKDTPASIWARS